MAAAVEVTRGVYRPVRGGEEDREGGADIREGVGGETPRREGAGGGGGGREGTGLVGVQSAVEERAGYRERGGPETSRGKKISLAARDLNLLRAFFLTGHFFSN